MPHVSTVSRLALIAEDQWGLVTRRQAAAGGVSPATLQRLSADGSILERVAHGVYHLAGAPVSDHAQLRAAWLQLAPETLAWERTADQGVVSHRSAAAVHGLGHLPADRHEFTLPGRRQVRRSDVRVHRRKLDADEWQVLLGLPVTIPSRVIPDLLAEHEDPEAVGHVAADALRSASDCAGTFAATLAPHAAQFGLRGGDGLALLRWLLDLVGDPETRSWIDDAQAAVTHLSRSTDPATGPEHAHGRSQSGG